jgi:hypothetical protein
MLWSIDNANFDNQYRYISALAAGAQVPQTDSTQRRRGVSSRQWMRFVATASPRSLPP